MTKKLGYVSLFSSAGLGCYGFNLEDFDCIVTSELIPRRIEVQKSNTVSSLDTGYVTGDITKQEVRDQIFNGINIWKSTYKQNDVDVLVATPPCQGISVANHKKKDEINRNSLVVESIKIIKEVLPRYFVFENVRGFLNTLCTDVDGVDRAIQEAIRLNLGGDYNIGFEVVNLKERGSNSSRTRTIVVGVRKDIEEVTPYDLFPKKVDAPTLRELIGDLPELNKMGVIQSDDIFHSFRAYSEHMLPWIADTKEGQSAFDNEDPLKRPHKIVDGAVVQNQNKNGDKYTRCYWDQTAPCVHTRNDILASQKTIHPSQPRVFSIRELMRFMSVPESFRWTSHSLDELNNLTDEEKRAYLKRNEINIRQCLGEGVPTGVFRSIARNVKNIESKEPLSLNKIKRLIIKNELDDASNLLNFLSAEKLDFISASKIAELANAKRLDDAAFYTRQDMAYGIVFDLPDFKTKKTLRILEPSVGVGNFLPSLFKKYENIPSVKLDLLDISNESIQILKRVLKTINVPSNFEIRMINDDFLLHEFRNKYDIVVGNPPFGKVDSSKYAEYKTANVGLAVKSRNLFALFYEKALKIGDVVAFVSPKSVLNAPEFENLRLLLVPHSIATIKDYGEKGFSGVKIETVSMQIQTSKKPGSTSIESDILRSYVIHDQDYITDPFFPYWLIYRNDYFDAMADKLELGMFTALRDRSLSSKNMHTSGKVRVIKSRNIASGKISSLDTDMYVDSHTSSVISNKYFDAENVIVAPNLSYYPRAAILPKNTIVDGSAAILLPKNNILVHEEDLDFFASREYFIFYRIARNYATRSLNIDSGSVFFWAIPKVNIEYKIFDEENRSQYLFSTAANYFSVAP